MDGVYLIALSSSMDGVYPLTNVSIEYIQSIYELGREQKLKAFSQLLLLVTFKDLRKIIEENQKLDDDKLAGMRLRLWPAESDNGNSHNNNRNNGWGWKGRPIISSEEWKRLAGYTEFKDNLTAEEKEYLKINLDLPGETWDRAESEIRREINPRALQYFPQDIVTVVFNPAYSCPKTPDHYRMWISDYRELLTAKGYREREYDGSWWEEEWERLNTDWRARVGASEK